MNATRDYRLLAIASLGVVGLALFSEGYGLWALAVVGPGLFALLVGWWIGPATVLLLLTALLTAGSPYRWVQGGFAPLPVPSDIFLASALFVYVGAAMRYHSLSKQALPSDRRRTKPVQTTRARGRWLLPTGPTKRTPERAGAGEFVWLIVLAVLFTSVAFLIAFRIQLEVVPEGIALGERRLGPRVWRALLCLWGLVLALLGGRVLVKCLGWMSWNREEARLFLQDQLWAETRGEQRRIQRWAVAERHKQEGA